LRRRLDLIVPDNEDLGETGSQCNLLDDLEERLHSVVGENDCCEAGRLGRNEGQEERVLDARLQAHE